MKATARLMWRPVKTRLTPLAQGNEIIIVAHVSWRGRGRQARNTRDCGGHCGGQNLCWGHNYTTYQNKAALGLGGGAKTITQRRSHLAKLLPCALPLTWTFSGWQAPGSWFCFSSMCCLPLPMPWINWCQFWRLGICAMSWKDKAKITTAFCQVESISLWDLESDSKIQISSRKWTFLDNILRYLVPWKAGSTGLDWLTDWGKGISFMVEGWTIGWVGRVESKE